MKVRVITMNTQGDRFKNFEANAKRFNLSYEVVLGVDASNATIDCELGSQLKEKKPGTTKGMLGCTIAHMRLFKEIAAQDEIYAVFEDDAGFLPNFDLAKAEKALKENHCGILHLQAFELKNYSEHAKGLVRLNDRCAISTSAYLIKPEAARDILSRGGKTKEGEPIASKVIDYYFHQLNMAGIPNGVLIPLMVCHTGTHSVVADSSLLVPIEDLKEKTFEEEKRDALLRVSLSVKDSTLYGLVVGEYKIPVNSEIIEDYKSELVLLRTEEDILETEEEKEEFFNQKFELSDVLKIKYELTLLEYKKYLIKAIKKFDEVLSNANKKVDAIKESKTKEELFEIIKVMPI